MTGQAKFRRGERVLVRNGVGSHLTSFRVVYEARQVGDVRRRGDRFEYRMSGASYWVAESRVSEAAAEPSGV